MLNEKLKKQIKKHKVSIPKELKSLFKSIDSTYEEIDDLRKYQEIFNLSPEAIVVLDNMGMIIDANIKLKEWIGYDPEKYKGKNMLGVPFLDKKNKVIVMKQFLKRMAGKKVEPYDLEFIHKKGGVKIGRIFAKPILNSKGKIIQDIALILDVTKQKKAEEKLRASEKRFEDLAKSSGDWFWEINAEGKYTYASGKVKKILGYEPKELIGKSPFDLMTKEDAKSVGEKFKKIVSLKKPIIDLENWNITKDGKKICLVTNGVPIFDSEENYQGYRGVDKDITERKAIAQERRRKVLDSLSYSSEQLLKGAKWNENVANILRALGEAARVSRVYIFKNSTNEKKRIITSQIAEWTARGITHQLDNEELQNFDCVKNGLKRWVQTLSQNKIISGLVKDFPKLEHKVLSPEKIKSVIVVPIFVNDNWWGSIGFDECKEERIWRSSELDVLKAIANIIGSAIERDNAQSELQKVNDDLSEKTRQMEQFNKLMVGRELKMIEFKKEIARLKSLLGHQNNK